MDSLLYETVCACSVEVKKVVHANNQCGFTFTHMCREPKRETGGRGLRGRVMRVRRSLAVAMLAPAYALSGTVSYAL